jgi:hypothetical protein
MNDRFLERDGVRTVEDALAKSLQGALQRSLTYRDYVSESKRKAFRKEWQTKLREESIQYLRPGQPISDTQHCETILKIADSLSRAFEEILHGGRLRFGVSQKALNLYLKYLWRLGRATTPPHCPLDSIVLAKGRIVGAWTKCDTTEQYMEWISQLTERAKPLGLAQWEYDVWLDKVEKSANSECK